MLIFLLRTGLVLLISVKSVFAAAEQDKPGIRRFKTPFPGSTLFAPNDGRSHPGVILLHGSEGGTWSYSMLAAQALAYEGYAALAFCYASCPLGEDSDIYLPHVELHNVELNKTYEAMEWLVKSSFVQGKKLAIHGISRGAEHALLLASLMAANKANVQPAAVAVHAPSDVIWAGWNWQWDNELCRNAKGEWNIACGVSPPPTGTGIQAWLWHGDEKPVAPKLRIEIEKYPGAVLIIHGEMDRIWPAAMSRRIQKIIEGAGRKPEVHFFAEEGHIFKEEARYEEHKILLEFLHRTLGQ